MNSSQAALRGGRGTPRNRGEADIMAFLPGQAGEGFDPENLRQKINNKEYIYGAIQRIAQVLSNELLKISRGGIYERQRKRRK
jgi:hypothetical protein